MNFAIIKYLAGLMRVFWKDEYRDYVESIKIEMREDEDIESFLKRLNSMGDERSILKILNTMLLDNEFQNHCNNNGWIESRQASDIRYDMITLLQNDGFKVEKDQVMLPPFSNALQFEKYVKQIFETLGYKTHIEPPQGNIRPDLIVSEKNNPEEKIIVEIKHYEKSLVTDQAIQQLIKIVKVTNASKGILVSSNGFSESAKHISSETKQIEILTLEELLKRIPENENQEYFKEIARTKLIHSEEEIIEEQETSGLKDKKKKLLDDYNNAISETDSNKKGKMLESLMVEIFSMVPKLELMNVRMNNGVEEIDIQLRNNNRKGVWADFDGVIFIECKNWSTSIGSPVIDEFWGKLEPFSINAGIIVSINDITGDDYRGARAKIKSHLSKNRKIIILNGDDILEILNCTDVSDKIEDKFKDLYKL